MPIKQIVLLPWRGARTREHKPLTWEELLEIGLGELNMHPCDLYEYSMQEFVLKLRGARRSKMEQWQHTRALAYVIAKPNLKNKNLKIEKFWPLPGDSDANTTVKRISAMSLEEKMQRIKQIREHLINNGAISDN
jgi:hypothetical protein